MTHQDIIQQLEFFRDIGVQTISLLDARPAAAATVPPVDTLEAIRSDIGDCQRCKLAPTRTTIVFGSGNPNAEIVFVGEAPGYEEDQQGLPFVGEAGRLLTKIIESIGIKREDAYICNILKCRPPGNRNPEPDEVLVCSPFLKRQIAAIRPKIVCCLGKFAAQTMLQTRRSHFEASRRIPRHRRHAGDCDIPSRLPPAFS